MRPDYEIRLTEGNILRTLLSFAFPVLLALFLQAMYGAADLIIVGKFSGTADQSGVASGSQLLNLITMVITGLSMGVTVSVGNAIGAGDSEKAGRSIGNGIVLFSLTSIVLTMLLVLFSDQLTTLLHTPEEAFSQTRNYIRICGIGTIFITAYNVICAVFRGIGDARTPLLTVFLACLINITGDLILVAGFGLGAAGAAAATVSAQAVSVFCALWIIRRRKLPFPFSIHCLYPRTKDILHILAIGGPIALQELLVQFSFLFIQIIVNQMGVTESAAVGTAEKVCTFLMLAASAYMQSISAFVAQNNGAGLPQRSRQALAYGIMTALLSGLIMGSAALWGGDKLASIFSAENTVILSAHDYLKSYAIDCILTAILFCMIGYFNGCGKTFFVMIQGIIGAFLIRIPAVFFLSQLENAGLFQIGLATPISSAVQILLCLIAYRIFRKKT